MVEHHVGELVVAVHDPRLVDLRGPPAQPVGGDVQSGDLPEAEPLEVGEPAVDLALVEAVGPAQPLEAHGPPVHPGEAGDGIDQFEGEAPAGAEVGEERLRPLGLADRRPAVDERHQVEVGSDHVGVVAAGDGTGMGDVRVGQCLDDPVLAQHRLVAAVGDPGRWSPEGPALPATRHLEQLVGGPAGYEPAVDGLAPAGEPLPVEPGPETAGIDELPGPLGVCV